MDEQQLKDDITPATKYIKCHAGLDPASSLFLDSRSRALQGIRGNDNFKVYCCRSNSFVKSCKSPFSSFRRRPESSDYSMFWTPAFAGVTIIALFTVSSSIKTVKNRRHE